MACLVLSCAGYSMAQMCVTCSTGRVHVQLNKLACQGIKDNLVTMINLLALDSFLYEEETYNYFGHSGNVLVEERKMGILLEVVCAFVIFHVVQQQYAKEKSWRPKSMGGAQGKGGAMV